MATSTCDSTAPGSRVVIAVLTYQRLDDLRAVLPLLVEQASSANTDGWSASVLVVDNEPEATARATVAAAASEAAQRGVALRYEHEPVPGISAARNRALEASADHDILVFIDDDERPSASWLRLLLDTHRTQNADVVQGPVISEFEEQPDSWITAGGFFQRRRMPTGTLLDVAVTNNLLLDLRLVRRLGLRFDLNFGTTGGEDTLFTKALHRTGARMVWNDEAYVVDVVPKSRSRRQWVTQRAWSMGNSTALVELKLAGSRSRRLATRLHLTRRGLTRVIGGLSRTTVGRIIRNERHNARGTRTFLRGMGMMLGAWGYAYHEYGRKKSAEN